MWGNLKEVQLPGVEAPSSRTGEKTRADIVASVIHFSLHLTKWLTSGRRAIITQRGLKERPQIAASERQYIKMIDRSTYSTTVPREQLPPLALVISQSWHLITAYRTPSSCFGCRTRETSHPVVEKRLMEIFQPPTSWRRWKKKKNPGGRRAAPCMQNGDER